MVAIVAMAADSPAVSKISVDHGPAALARLPNRRLQRTTRRVEIPGIVALRKVVAAVVIKVVAEAVAILALRHPAVVDRAAAVVIAVVADPEVAVVATAVAADPTAEAMAGSCANLTT